MFVVTNKQTQTEQSFSEKWRDKVWLSVIKTENGVKDYEEQLCATLGVSDIIELDSLFKDGMNVLDVGCGYGWAEYLFNLNEKVNRFAMDVSSSVKTASEITRLMGNVLVIKATLWSIPFKKEFFDIIFSIGVIHHTGSAKLVFTELCKYLKPGGLIGIYIYKKKPFIRALVDKELRKMTTEMSYDECLKFSGQLALLGKSLQKIKEKVVITEDISLLNIKKGTYKVQQLIYDYFLKCHYDSKLGVIVSALANLDWYHPKLASFHTKEEITKWFEKNNITGIKFIQPKGWEWSGYFVSGRKV